MGSSNESNYNENQIIEHFKIYNYENDSFTIDGHVHQNEGMQEFVYKLDVNIPNSVPPEFIFIVDQSGSMGSNFNYIITKTIPEVLDALKYNDRKIHLITFESCVYYYSLSKSELSKSQLSARGGTNMAESFNILEKIFSISKDKCRHFRILTISDGALSDQERTKEFGESLYQKYQNIFKINSQCIRLKNGSGYAESVGLMSVLKFNNVKQCHLVEHNSNDMANLAKVIIPLFLDDGLIGCSLKIKSEGSNIKNNPWDKNDTNTQPLEKGKITIFGDKNQPLYIENENKKEKIYIKCEKGEEINTDNYEEIIGKEKLNNMFQKLKMNKILNTAESQNENISIANYFKNLSKKTKRVNDSDNNLEYINEQIDYINNDNSIYYLNEDQKANYVQNLNDMNRIIEINMLKKDNKKLKKQMEEMMNFNINLSNELHKLQKKFENLEKNVEIIGDNNKKNETKINNNEKETISIKKDVEEMKMTLKEKEEEKKKKEEEKEKEEEEKKKNEEENIEENKEKVENVEKEGEKLKEEAKQKVEKEENDSGTDDDSVKKSELISDQ